MKTTIRTLASLIAIFVLAIGTTWAQDETTTAIQAQKRQMLKQNVSAEAQVAAAEAQAARQAQREAFMATLSEEQLAILNNTELSREEKQELLKASLTDEQLALMEANQVAREANQAARETRQADQQAKRDANINGLSEEQRQSIQNRQMRNGQ